jgi:hypothetical protein
VSPAEQARKERHLQRELQRIGVDPNDRRVEKFNVDTYFHIIQNSAGAGGLGFFEGFGLLPVLALRMGHCRVQNNSGGRHCCPATSCFHSRDGAA